MDDLLGSRIHEWLKNHRGADETYVRRFATALAAALRGKSEPVPIRSLRDHLTQVLQHVRHGDVQVLGETPEEQVVIISVKDLARLIRLLDGSVSFADALSAQPGFRPVDVTINMQQRNRGTQTYFGFWPADEARNLQTN